MKNAPGVATKHALLPVVDENIETGYNITENNKQNGSDITVEVRGQDEPREVGCVEQLKCFRELQ